MEFAGNSLIICYLVIVMTVTFFIIRMNPQADKRIVRSDWLTEWVRWVHLPRSDFPRWSRKKKLSFWPYYSLCKDLREYNGDVLNRATRK